MRFKREADLIICRLDSVKITRTNESAAKQKSKQHNLTSSLPENTRRPKINLNLTQFPHTYSHEPPRNFNAAAAIEWFVFVSVLSQLCVERRRESTSAHFSHPQWTSTKNCSKAECKSVIVRRFCVCVIVQFHAEHKIVGQCRCEEPNSALASTFFITSSTCLLVTLRCKVLTKITILLLII